MRVSDIIRSKISDKDTINKPTNEAIGINRRTGYEGRVSKLIAKKAFNFYLNYDSYLNSKHKIRGTPGFILIKDKENKLITTACPLEIKSSSHLRTKQQVSK